MDCSGHNKRWSRDGLGQTYWLNALRWVTDQEGSVLGHLAVPPLPGHPLDICGQGIFNWLGSWSRAQLPQKQSETSRRNPTSIPSKPKPACFPSVVYFWRLVWLWQEENHVRLRDHTWMRMTAQGQKWQTAPEVSQRPHQGVFMELGVSVEPLPAANSPMPPRAPKAWNKTVSKK